MWFLFNQQFQPIWSLQPIRAEPHQNPQDTAALEIPELQLFWIIKV